jgi:hypothetical protein
MIRPACLEICRQGTASQEHLAGRCRQETGQKCNSQPLPHHNTIEKPEDKATNPAACADWIRLRDRLKEGKQWLAV